MNTVIFTCVEVGAGVGAAVAGAGVGAAVAGAGVGAGILLQLQATLPSLQEVTPLTVMNDNIPRLVHDGFEAPQQAVPQDVSSVQEV